MSLSQFIAHGNTQPGGFYDGGATEQGGFPVMETPRDAPVAQPLNPNKTDFYNRHLQQSKGAASSELYAAPALYAGTGQTPSFMGEKTTKL